MIPCLRKVLKSLRKFFKLVCELKACYYVGKLIRVAKVVIIQELGVLHTPMTLFQMGGKFYWLKLRKSSQVFPFLRI